MEGDVFKFRIVLTGGGTGGHIMPLLALLSHLGTYPVDLLYIGGKGGREEELAKQRGLEFTGITVGKLRRYLTITDFTQNIIDLGRTCVGIFQSLRILAKFKPHAIIAKGGYVSFPVLIAGWVLRIPILVHESDIVIGLSNRLGIKLAKRVATGFSVENYKGYLPEKLVFTGIPVEEEFFRKEVLKKDFELFCLDPERKTLLVTGGIQGARKINEAVRGILPELLKKWQVIHLAGELDYPELANYKESLDNKDRYLVFPALGQERIAAMRLATVVVSRASATTLAELAALEKPIITIPLTSAANNHQEKNAQLLEKAGAVATLRENELTGNKLYETIEGLMESKESRDRLAKGIAGLNLPDSGRLLVEEVLAMIR